MLQGLDLQLNCLFQKKSTVNIHEQALIFEFLNCSTLRSTYIHLWYPSFSITLQSVLTNSKGTDYGGMMAKSLILCCPNSYPKPK